jgi:hydroxypyruvate reductase
VTPRRALEEIFRAGVDACRAEVLLPPHLPPLPRGRMLVLAVGKAAVPMARVAEAGGYDRLEGLVVAPHGFPDRPRRLPMVYAGHPVPDQASEAAAQRLLDLAAGAGEDDLVLVLLSGGASALASAPGPGLTLAGKQAVVRSLLRSGAPIAEINCVRRHLSAIKGGRLAATAFPARTVTLAVSDVVGDVPQAIGSGPTVADASTIAQAVEILARYGVRDPGAGWSETPKPGDPRLERSSYKIVGSNRDATAAAAEAARRLGYEPVLLGEAEGEAREVGAAHARRALERAGRGGRFAMISGGELTVTITGPGRGGPNQEYALALALGLAAEPGVHALACDTDGVDGTEQAAGAFVAPDTLARAQQAGLDPQAMLAANDSGGFFGGLGDLLVTGQTGVNVNDLRIVIGG